ncbi:MAG TPA: maleylacetoacetate isomerase [Gammaproteobacteria bacterium]|nr:maleylacetoacetate isomerase [Gammaproteobacteria bacterium]
MSKLSLYTYFRSSAAYRVRIALSYKGLPYESKMIHLLKNGGEENSAAYESINPQKMIPSLVDDGHIITQSLAIIEYIDEKYPEPGLLPVDLTHKAQVRSLALAIACDIHPLNNLRVIRYLYKALRADEAKRNQWMLHWMNEGFSAIEKKLASLNSKNYCYGRRVSLADLCLIPQVYNALRFDCDMRDFPRINQIYEHCMKQAEFIAASPEQQPDCDIRLD